MTSADPPCVVDPPEGFIVSANERPPDSSPLVGRHFSPPDRKRRLTHLVTGQDRISIETIARMQRDTQWEAALAQCRTLLGWLDMPGIGYLNGKQRCLVDAIANWDGRYDATSRGALAFELLCYHLAGLLVPTQHRVAYDAA
jgi:penicillin amidase